MNEVQVLSITVQALRADSCVRKFHSENQHDNGKHSKV